MTIKCIYDINNEITKLGYIQIFRQIREYVWYICKLPAYCFGDVMEGDYRVNQTVSQTDSHVESEYYKLEAIFYNLLY